MTDRFSNFLEEFIHVLNVVSSNNFDIHFEFNIFVVPSDDFGICGYVRVSYCVKEETIKRIDEIIESIG